MHFVTEEIELAPLVAAFGRRLREAGLPITPDRSARFAAALTHTKPVSRTRLYWTARAVLVSDQSQVKAFNDVFFSVFGGTRPAEGVVPPQDMRTAPAPPDERGSSPREGAGGDGAPGASPGREGGAAGRGAAGTGASRGEREAGGEAAVPVLASDEERLREKVSEEILIEEGTH